MSSILTNNSAMVALQTLKSVNQNLAKTQDMISTGKEIGKAKDNSAIWAISKVMESDVSGFNAVSKALGLGEATVAVASAGAEQIVKLLNEMKEKVVAGTGGNVDHGKLTNDVTELKDQITAIIAGAQFNGANLLSGASPANDITVLASINRTNATTVAAANITVKSLDFTTDLALNDVTVTNATTSAASIAT